jgi:hypothetical protein
MIDNRCAVTAGPMAGVVARDRNAAGAVVGDW